MAEGRAEWRREERTSRQIKALINLVAAPRIVCSLEGLEPFGDHLWLFIGEEQAYIAFQ